MRVDNFGGNQLPMGGLVLYVGLRRFRGSVVFPIASE